MTRPDKQSELISTTTILILAGVIIGMTVCQVTDSEFLPYLYAAGVSGFIAFISLDMAATKRFNEELKQEQLNIENRLDRHTQSLMNIGFQLEAEEKQSLNRNERELCTYSLETERHYDNQLVASA